jgi:hypothetical protein
MKHRTVSLGGVLIAAGAWLALSAPAFAQIPPSRMMPSPFAAPPPMGSQAAAGPVGAPSVARYMADGNLSFTLDASGPAPLLRYSNSSEIFALHPQPAPRGDTLFVNDMGETMLRATRLGGLTAFTPAKPQGAAAALSGPGSPLNLPDIRSATQLFVKIGQTADRISRMSGREMLLDANVQSGPETFPLVADAVALTLEAFTKVTSAQYVSRKKTWVSNLGVVKFIEGEPPRAYVEKDALVVIITPGRGVSGRPSSLRIVKALTR